MDQIPQVPFWDFVLRVFGRAASDVGSYFGVNVKTFATAGVLLAVGLVMYFRVRGLAAVQEHVANSWWLTGFPAALFIAALILWNLFRAPYVVYSEEYAKAVAAITKAEGAQSQAEAELKRLRPFSQRVAELEQQVNEAEGRVERAEGLANGLRQERDAARAQQRNAPAPAAAQGQRLSVAQCQQMATHIANLSGAVNRLRAERISAEAEAHATMITTQIRDWLGDNVGPVQRQSFLSAQPIGGAFEGMPLARGGLWQLASGRLAYLRQLADRIC